MAAAFGAIGRIDYGARTNTVIPLPAGVANGNFLYMGLVTANSGTAVTAALPAGWTQIGTAQTGSDGSFGLRYVEAWRIASSEPASYTCTHAASNSEGHIISVTGSGTLSIDANSQNVSGGSGLNLTTALGVTTTQPNDLLLFNALNWDETALTPPTGMTERQDSQFLYIASQVIAAAGATGDRTQAHNTNPWFGNLLAIKDVAATGGRMKVWTGSAWVEKPAKVWTGSAWVEKPVKVWNGSAWVLA